MSAIRRANPKSKSWRETLNKLSSDKIINTQVDTIPVTPLFTEYPFSEQEIIRGIFSYLLFSPTGESKEIEMTFYYRTGSDLFILDPGRRDNLVDQVVYELRDELTNQVKILPGASISRTGIWNFIRSADEVREVIIQSGLEEKSYDTLPPEEIGKKKVKRADLVFRYENRFDVVYTEDRLSINSTGEEFEYAIQKFETEAIYKG